jgi:hypothetical protein
VTENQIELGRHALGLPNKQRESYRNHFVAGPAHDDYAEWAVMVSEGNAVRLERSELYGGDFCFNLTRIGAEKCLKGKERLDADDFRLRESSI